LVLGYPDDRGGIVYEGTTVGSVLALDERDGHTRDELFVPGRGKLWAYRLEQ
jgi:hypothetical protein